ncbi:division/cell wall cluster transcriptional repressor MraZ [Conexibacter sp. SYSU D00693]|uniref:division/cell wall cluster transcriptional repressor MraZ n=1 Tax=Conexibacter sp. SYSU D00693 TaxID=2812560 RepID=UPI00196AA598|nr:division/cell wall cluster transcriptional repressor MraZ [Conexibacter sp. SYSU D00693]
MAFDGTADYSLDAKNRLTVPARFRELLQDGVVLAKATEPCVAIWPKAGYDSYRRAALEGVHPMSQNATKLKRFFAANSQPTDLDSAGRVGVPQFLMDHANLGKEVTVIGADDHLEVWDRKAWTDYNESLTADVLAISQSFDGVDA